MSTKAVAECIDILMGQPPHSDSEFVLSSCIAKMKVLKEQYRLAELERSNMIRKYLTTCAGCGKDRRTECQCGQID